jgi:hypothetical protein
VRVNPSPAPVHIPTPHARWLVAAVTVAVVVVLGVVLLPKYLLAWDLDGGARTWTNCGNISGYGAFCFRRTHAIEYRYSAIIDRAEWRGWVKLECLLNGAKTNCNFRHLNFRAYGNILGLINWKDFPDELNKPVALYGGTFRDSILDPNREYRQQTGLYLNPSYYARHVASGYRTVWRTGCSNWVDFYDDAAPSEAICT